MGAAGQIYVNEDGVIVEINLNFSGHYRPPISAEYARYTYQTLVCHPLLSFSPDCRISARKYFGLNTPMNCISFTPFELLSDDPALEVLLGDFPEEERFGDDGEFTEGVDSY